jgi:CheY-like chemotaxis protein
LAAREFDVLVSDLDMRPMNGFELLAKAYADYKDTQCILLTGFSDHGDLAEAVNNGHRFAHVQKPCDKARAGPGSRRQQSVARGVFARK